MITLAIDTSEARGSVALLRDGATASRQTHDDATDYSGWLLPAVNGVLRECQVNLEQVDLLAVSTGPGSFTGLRVGLTTVKAWAEVYGKRVVGVSRLEALANSLTGEAKFVAACFDAQRSQLFGGLYRDVSGRLEPIEEEAVSSPEEFVEFVDHHAGVEAVGWVSLDPELIETVDRFKGRIKYGDRLIRGSAELAPVIGMLAQRSAVEGKFSDAVTLDANYVRRSDAEIFWKGPGAHVR